MSRSNTPEIRLGLGWWATSPLPGAIGVLHLVGDVEAMLARLRVTAPDIGRTTLTEVGGIDEAVVARLDVDACLVMPHGGPRIRQLLSRAVEDAGVPLRRELHRVLDGPEFEREALRRHAEKAGPAHKQDRRKRIRVHV